MRSLFINAPLGSPAVLIWWSFFWLVALVGVARGDESSGSSLPELSSARVAAQAADACPEEIAFAARVEAAIARHQSLPLPPKAPGERGERWYALSFYHYLSGQRESAVDYWETAERSADDHRWTEGIDLYWAPVLPAKVRAYRDWESSLSPPYLERMKRAARQWTAEDPRPGFELIRSLDSPDALVRQYALGILQKMAAKLIEQGLVDQAPTDGDPADWIDWWRPIAATGWLNYEEWERLANPFPHPHWQHGVGQVGQFWGPSHRGLRVDGRNTDGLRARRDTSVYLLAEAAGQENVRRLYKDKIRTYVRDLYHVGLGEWDSQRSLPQILVPFHNLYDLAEDEEVVDLARAALDWLYTSAALKYERGVLGGPGRKPGRGSEEFLELIFGTSPCPESFPYSSETVFAAISTYRIPPAIRSLVRREFSPGEILATKPAYNHFLPDQGVRPEVWETLYFGETFTLGTINSPTSSSDTQRWSLLIDQGPDLPPASLMINSGKNPDRGLRAEDQTGQFKHLVLWLRPNDGTPLSLALPAGSMIEWTDQILFIRIHQTWLAFRPIGLKTSALAKLPGVVHRPTTVESGPQPGTPLVGFALEIGEARTHRSFGRFRANVLAGQVLEVENLADGEAHLLGSSGLRLGLTYRPGDLPQVNAHGDIRDGSRRDIWNSPDGVGPVSLGWREGLLRVTAGPHVLEQKVTADGHVRILRND